MLLACRTDTPAPPEASPPDVAMSFIFADVDPSPAALPEAGALLREIDLAPYTKASPEKAKSIGHTSVVFRLDLSGGLRAAYKPESKRGRKRYRGEVAAYRLAKALGLPNVPPAMVRVFSRAPLRASADPKALTLMDEELVDRGGRVYGALIPWIDKLEFSPLEAPAQQAQWKRWLKAGGEIPEGQQAMAAQISNLLVFDAVTANWDRWSGGNVGIDRPSGTLLFMDNDGAFFDPPPPGPLAAQMALVRGSDRFSRALVVLLRALEPIKLADAIGEEDPGVPLLSASVLSAVDQRRKEVLHVIDQKIRAQGEPAVLVFP